MKKTYTKMCVLSESFKNYPIIKSFGAVIVVLIHTLRLVCNFYMKNSCTRFHLIHSNGVTDDWGAIFSLLKAVLLALLIFELLTFLPLKICYLQVWPCTLCTLIFIIIVPSSLKFWSYFGECCQWGLAPAFCFIST